MVKEMLQNRNDYLCVVLVQEFERVNSSFWQTNKDPYSLFDELNIHHRSLRNRVLDLAGKKKSLETVDFGVKYKAECTKTLLHHKSSPNYQDMIKIIIALKQRCFNVLK